MQGRWRILESTVFLVSNFIVEPLFNWGTVAFFYNVDITAKLAIALFK